MAPFWAAVNEMLAGLTVRPDESGAPLSPPQAASSNTRPAHRPSSTQEARPIKLSSLLLWRRMTETSGDKLFSFFCGFRADFQSNSFTTGKAGQRIRSYRDVMTSSRDAVTQIQSRVLRTRN